MKGATTVHTRLPARFWAKVDRSGGEDACHPWQGSLVNGYGQFCLGGKNHTVHRLIYESVHGSAKGAKIGHSCRMDHCGNPKHIHKIVKKPRRSSGRGRGRPRTSVVRIGADRADKVIRMAADQNQTVDEFVGGLIDQIGA